MTTFAINSKPGEALQLLQALEALAKKNGVNLLDEGVIPPSASYEDYVHPNRGHALYNTNIALAAITFCFVVARLWTRIRIAGGLGADDYMIILAIVVVICSTFLQCYAVKEAGFGKHYYDITIEETHNLLKVTYAMPIIYSVGVALVKLSILLFYKRLFPSNARMQKICNWFMIFQGLFTVGACFGFAFICTPVKGWWHLDLRPEACPTFVNTMRIYVGLRVVTVACDIVVVCLPMHMVWKLKIPARQKLGLAALFGLGIIACGVAVARLALLPNMLLHLDAGWNIIPIAILDQFEQCVGIITASIPALAALVSRHRRERKSMQITTATHSKSSGSVEPPKKGNRGRYGSADGNTREPFDFFAFAYDPDRYKGNEFGQTYACAYSGNQKRPVPPGHRDSFITVHTDSEELVHRHPIDAIAATTTVTVNVTQR